MTAKVYYPPFWSSAKRRDADAVEPPPATGPKLFRCYRCQADYRFVRLTGLIRDTGRYELRLDRIARQYRCPCGHVGWSQCEDLRFAKGLA